ncbi:hypothetical protein, partial [Xanthomarina sp. F2636L]|uniref:hypothetical protein n=1 Tax=Xanthomarina sp. F2636L TaxID=2996018 RepID=UPI00225E6F6C
MKKETIIRFPKSTILLLLAMILSFQSFADVNCGHIEGFMFSNGQNSVMLENGGNYNITDLPQNFYIDLNVEGYSQSVKYYVQNLDTGERVYITENVLPYTFPTGNQAWNLGAGNFKISASLYKYDFGFGRRCDKEIISFTLNEECLAFAGSITATESSVELINGMATISGNPNGDAFIPDGYISGYVLTKGNDLIIMDGDDIPSFPVTEPGNYIIHTLIYNPNTLDVGIVEFGVTTGFDVYGLITEGGGDICASLDVAGAPIMVTSCEADAGTLMADADTACLINGAATISATANNDSNVPEGYETVYVLTEGSGLVIVNAGAIPSFEVTEGGDYTIHSLVYNPETLDLGIVVPGVTTGFDVYGLITEGGGDICASLDVAGAPVSVENPHAGTLSADMDSVTLVDGLATVSATANGDANVPEGYQTVFVLTQGSGLVIMNAGASPNFEVSEAGDYTIHSLVYNPETLDLGIVVPGVTTGFDVYGLITEGGGDICA